MHRTRIAGLLVAAVLLAAGTACSSSDSPEPAASTSTPTDETTSAPAKVSKSETIRRCTNAVADRAADTSSGEVHSEPTPKPCAGLPDSEYLDAYMDGIRQANQAGRDELERQLDDATP
ncbi:hypothetical protein [Streptomyces boncukensis]|uniref:Lipoprotein n=1 Tax=Streptomyces boncukensis TaxID=2711219 RepID=A0A6G4XA44_9ACTN|nr:hypothetical protein [Streptomyces boncukensis]NGO73531.1 hypothetical protein [Streptomyces boncukensis]